MPNKDLSRVPGGDFMGIDMGCGDADKENVAAGFERKLVSDENQPPVGSAIVNTT